MSESAQVNQTNQSEKQAQRAIYRCALFSPCLMFASWTLWRLPSWVKLEWILIGQLITAIASVIFCSLIDSTGGVKNKLIVREFIGWLVVWSLVQLALHLASSTIAVMLINAFR